MGLQPNFDTAFSKTQRSFWSGYRIPALVLASALILGTSSCASTAQMLPGQLAPVSASATESAAPTETATAAATPTATATQDAPAPSAAPEPAPAAAPAPAPEPAPAPAAPAPDPAIAANAYTIVTGDTVSGVAARYGVDLAGMLAANGLTIYTPIMPGEVLKFTGPAVPLRVPAPAPAPAQKAAVQSAPVQNAAPAPAAPAGRVITLAGSGGQDMINRCIGPIHFTPVWQSYSITEHDYCGGWARFSGIQVGETVTIPGVGTYKVTGRGVVPNPGTVDNLAAVLGGIPPVFLQTCIPGTRTMLVIGLG